MKNFKKMSKNIKKWTSVYLSLLFPGLGQLFLEKYKKGTIILFIALVSVVLTIITIWFDIPFNYRLFAIIPYIIVLFYSIIDAYISQYLAEKTKKERLLWMLLILIIAIITFVLTYLGYI